MQNPESELTPAEVRRRLERALEKLLVTDRYLLENDLSERCIASRLAMHLQMEFQDHCVDVEYNRVGDVPKRLALPDDCANYRDAVGRAIVVPDVVVHRRGPDGPNLLVLELKKASNPERFGCDRARVAALRRHMGYSCGALVACETGQGQSGLRIEEWLSE
jgi:hypothetical protein